MKGAFLLGDGRGRTTRTNGLDAERTIPYTEAVDEAAYKGNRSPFSACHLKAGLVSEVSPDGAEKAD